MGELYDFTRSSGDSTKNQASGPRLALTHELLNDIPLLNQSAYKNQFTADNIFGRLTLTNNDADTKLATRPRVVTQRSDQQDQQQDQQQDEQPRTYNKQEVPKKAAETKDEQKDEKKEEKKEEKSDYKSTEKWGGDEQATKQRHKPLEIGIKEDGTGEITVKPGDTGWDYARRILEEQGKHQNPPHKPTNQEILAKLKELEELNGRKLDRIHPGEKIKVSQKDVEANKKDDAKKDDNGDTKKDDNGDTKKDDNGDNKKDNGDGTTTTTSKAGDKTYAVTRDGNNDPIKVEVSDAQGKHTYEKHDDGLWYLDGKLLPDSQQVAIGFKHSGFVVLKDEAGNETQIYTNGTVQATTNGKEVITTTDGTTYTKQDNGDYVKRTADGQETTIACASFHNDNGVVTASSQQQTDGNTQDDSKKDGTKDGSADQNTAAQSNEIDTENGVHFSIKARDKDGNPVEYTESYGGHVYHYKKVGAMWIFQMDNLKEVQLKGFDVRMDAQGRMIVTEQQGEGEKRYTRTTKLGPDGKQEVTSGPPRTDEYETNSGKYVITHRDDNGVPDKFTVTDSDGKEVHYQKNGENWENDANGQMQAAPEVSVSVTEKGVIYVTRTFGGTTSRGTSTIELNPDGTSNVRVTAPRAA